MLTLTQCWFTRKHSPSGPISKSRDKVSHSVCKSCDRPIVSWDRKAWHLAEGFNLLEVLDGQTASFLYLVDTRVDIVVARFAITHLKSEQEIEAYARQIRADNGVDDLESVLELRDSRKGLARSRLIKPRQPQPGALTASAHDAAADADRLTGLPGRASFEASFESECDRASARKAHLTVAFVDIDRFDEFNRAHGLDAGDALVRLVAAQLSGLGECQCYLSRQRGLEFLVLLRGAGAELAHSRLDNVRKSIARSRLPEALDEPLSISCGLAEVSTDADSRAALRAADLALRQARQRKGNAVVAGECGVAAASGAKTSWLGKRG